MISLVFIPSGIDASSADGLSESVAATAYGVLYDDAGSPRISYGSQGTIDGKAYVIATDDRDDLFGRLDQIHGMTHDNMLRTIIATTAGPAHSWHWTGQRDLPIIHSGRWITGEQNDLPGIDR